MYILEVEADTFSRVRTFVERLNIKAVEVHPTATNNLYRITATTIEDISSIRRRINWYYKDIDIRDFKTDKPEQTKVALETTPEPDRPEGYDIVEASQANTTRNYQPGETFYIYGSLNRPISASWARIPNAVYVNATGLPIKHADEFYTFVVVPNKLDTNTKDSYELTFLYGPIVYKPGLYIKAYEQEQAYNEFVAAASANLNISINHFKSWQELDPEDKEDFLQRHGTED